MRTDLEVAGLCKAYGAREALRGVDLVVEAGRFHAIVGPSGCGKSTLLRIVGGHEDADAGVVRLRGDDVTGVPPERRPVHTVFQHYALFPHLCVRDNVAFPLRMAGVPRDDRRHRADRALESVRLEGLGDRRPAALSGGERQRVALARALAGRPAVLLLDEPLGALDLQLRRAMQEELREVQRRSAVTFVHVTHDQEEALRLADTVTVMRDGRVVQAGDPREVYDRPATPFAASFLGVANVLPGRLLPGEGVFRTEKQLRIGVLDRHGDPRVVAIREERVRIETVAGDSGDAGSADGAVAGVVEDLAFLGATTRVTVVVTELGERLVGHAAPGARFARGDAATVRIDPDGVRLLPAEAAS